MLSHPATPSSPLAAARSAGALWLIAIVASIASVIGTYPLDWRADPAALTASAINTASSIRVGFALRFFGKICYLAVSVILYELLKPVNRTVALFSAFCGVAGLLSGISSFSDFTALSLLEESRRVAQPLADKLQASAVTIIATHSLEPGREDVFFGFQIGALGFLIARSHFIPRPLGLILLLGGVAFLVTFFTGFLSPTLDARLAPLLLSIVILGEGSLALWLLLRGVNVDRWRAAVIDRNDADNGVV
jgi:hypothetical protein